MNNFPKRKTLLLAAIAVILIVSLLTFWNYIFYPRPIFSSPWDVNSIESRNWIEKISSDSQRFRSEHYVPVTSEGTPPFQGKLYSGGCMLETYYAIYDTKTKKHITTKEQLIQAIGGIKSPEQAMAYMFTLNDYARGFVIDNSLLTPNYVKQEKDGYLVGFTMSLFCGCTHPSYAVQVSVKQNGDYKEVSRKTLNSDTKSGLCVD